MPLGTFVHARSGDKGGDANVGLWVRGQRPGEPGGLRDRHHYKTKRAARSGYAIEETTHFSHAGGKTVDRVELIEATFWLPIGTVEVWQAAQENTDIDRMMKGARGS